MKDRKKRIVLSGLVLLLFIWVILFNGCGMNFADSPAGESDSTPTPSPTDDGETGSVSG